MARIKCIRPVESLSGKLKKSDKVGFAVRKKTSKNFTVTRDDWSQTFKTDAKKQAALLHQLKFKTVALAAHERMVDPVQRQVDEYSFAHQSKYKSFFGYLFHLEWEAYED